jgi:hypothetical protein
MSDDERSRVEKDMANDCLIRKSEYANYKGNSGPVYLYGKIIGKLLGIKYGVVFEPLITYLSLSMLKNNVSFYKSHLKGKEIDLEKLVKKLT